ncbi:hypothetical protein MH280_004824, partial [Salmonella enterica]|nr:hypothetical protein [Salmonella enterica]
MLTALKGRGYSIRYHQTILKEYIRQRSVVFLPGSKLLSRRIVHTHHFPGSFQMKIFYRAMPTDRTGISVKSAKRAAINIDVFVINTRCNTKHSCPGGYIIFRTDNCFDVKRSLAVIKPTTGIRRYIPGTPFIANFSATNP